MYMSWSPLCHSSRHRGPAHPVGMLGETELGRESRGRRCGRGRACVQGSLQQVPTRPSAPAVLVSDPDRGLTDVCKVLPGHHNTRLFPSLL